MGPGPVFANLLLLLLALAAAQPQQINCPDGKIYGYLRDEETETDWRAVFVRVPANGLVECIRKCFGNHFCYSLSYDSGREEGQSCHLFYYSAYNCSTRQLRLLTSLAPPPRPVFVECLHCPSRLFSPATTFSGNVDVDVEEGSGEQEDDVPEQTIAVASSEVNEKKTVTAKQKECAGTLVYRRQNKGFLKSTASQPQFRSEFSVTSGAQCMTQCYNQGCVLAAYVPSQTTDREESTEATCMFAFLEDSDNAQYFNKHIDCDNPRPNSVVDEFDKTLELTKNASEIVQTTGHELIVALACIQCVEEGAELLTKPTEEISKKKPETEKYECDKEIYFLSSEIPNEISYQFQLPADSGAICARQCYERGCQVAHYNGQKKLCQLSSILPESISSDCHTADRSVYQSEISVSNANVSITCVVCDNVTEERLETQLIIERQPQTETIPLQLASQTTSAHKPTDDACTITFQVDDRHPIGDISYRDVFKVDSVADCASLCHDSSCSRAIFQPPTAQSNAEKALCKIQYSFAHTCSSFLPRHYNFPSHKAIILQCFKCLKEVPVTLPVSTETSSSYFPSSTTKAPVETSTQSANPVQNFLATKIFPTLSSENEKENAVCVITFQALDAFSQAVDHASESEISDSAAGCARLCYVRHCAQSVYDPSTKLCIFSYNNQSSLCHPNLERLAVFHSELQSWQQCISCDLIDDSTLLPEGARILPASQIRKSTVSNREKAKTNNVVAFVKEAGVTMRELEQKIGMEGGAKKEEAADSKTVKDREGIVKETGDVDTDTATHPSRLVTADTFMQECVITFQHDAIEERPSESMEGIEIEEKTRSGALCAHKCYRDGCTSASYDPKTNQCRLTYGDRPFCYPNKQTVTVYTGSQKIWIHCLFCEHLAKISRKTIEPIESNVKEDKEESKDNEDAKVGEKETVVLTTPENESPVQPKSSAKAPVKEPEQLDEKVFDGTMSAHKKPAEVTGDDVLISADKKTVVTDEDIEEDFEVNTEKEKSDEEKREMTHTEVIDVLTTEKPTIAPAIPTANADHFVKECVITFQHDAIEERPSESMEGIEIEEKTRSGALCAHKCYRDGCTSASYDPKTNQCRLTYGDRPFCYPNKQTVTVYTGSQKIWIHCLFCESARKIQQLAVTSKPAGIEEAKLEEKVMEDIAEERAAVILESDKALVAPLTAQISRGHSVQQAIDQKPFSVHKQLHFKRERCDGRVEFQIGPIGALDRLSISNDVPASTAADCAQKCLHTRGCLLAGFIPSPEGLSISNSAGVCLLTNNRSVCSSQTHFVPQHASRSPFAISCIQCTSCNYTLIQAKPSSSRDLANFDISESAQSVSECARKCALYNCSLAEFSAESFKCLLSTSADGSYQCAQQGTESSVTSEGPLPVQLRCVTCSS